MCTGMQAASAGFSIAQAALSIYGNNQQANAQAAAANFNGAQAVMQAQSAADAARVNEQATYRQGDLLSGQARAAMGANGIDPSSGSALAVQRDIATRTGQNVANEDYNARLGQTAALNQSGLLTAQAGYDHEAANINDVGTLLSTASQVSGKWAAWQQMTPTSVSGGGGGAGPNGSGTIAPGYGSTGGYS